MYPFVRFYKEMLKSRNAPALDTHDAHISTHICWPWDIDPWIELNNGRTLTLFDLGRIPMAQRMGLIPILRKNSWGIAVAGSSIRYRRRVRTFEKFSMVSRLIGWDQKFFYMEQSMWRRGECLNHMLLRSAVTSSQGIVPTPKVLAAMETDPESPALPAWVQAWIEADAQRIWPPELPSDVKGRLPV